MSGRSRQRQVPVNLPAAFFAGLMCFAVLGTGVAVIHVKYLTRQEFAVLQQVRAERDELDVEWGRLQIQEAALSTQTRIESNARGRLAMYVPQGPEVRVVEVAPLSIPGRPELLSHGDLQPTNLLPVSSSSKDREQVR